MILIILFFFISLSAQEHDTANKKAFIFELFKKAPENFTSHLSSIPEKILDSYDTCLANPPGKLRNPIDYYKHDEKAKKRAKDAYSEALKDLEAFIYSLRLQMSAQERLHEKALKLVNLHKKNEELFEKHILKIGSLVAECPQAFKYANVDGKELFLGFNRDEISRYLKTKGDIKDVGLLYQFLKLLDFTLTDQEAYQMNDDGQNIFKFYADSGINDSAIGDSIDYLNSLNEESAGCLENFFLYQMFLGAFEYSRNKAHVIANINEVASSMHDDARNLNAFLKWHNPGGSYLDVNNIKEVELPLFTYKTTLGKLADFCEEIKPNALKTLFSISAFSLNIEEKIIPGGYSTFGPKYLKGGSFGDLCEHYPAKKLTNASNVMLKDFIALLKKRLNDKKVFNFLQPITESALKRVKDSTVIKNPSIEPPIQAHVKKNKKKKKNGSLSHFSRSGSSQSEDSLPNSDDEESEDQDSNDDTQLEFFEQNKKKEILRESVFFFKTESPVFASYKKKLHEQKSELRLLWGEDMYEKIVNWTRLIDVYEKKESKFVGSVFRIEDKLDNQTTILYSFKKFDDNSLLLDLRNYGFADRVKKNLEKRIDNPKKCSRSETLHGVHPFVIALVGERLGDPVTYVSQKRDHQNGAVSLASIEFFEEDRKFKYEVAIQVAKNNKDVVYHAFAKPLDPDSLAELISFYGNTDREKVVIPQAYCIEEQA